MLAMMGGRSPPKGFNNNLGIFLPKGVQDDDTLASVNRSPDNTRPLGLKNTDNKTIAATVNYAIAHKVSNWADDSQNGFIIGRQGLNNIVTLDARARAFDHLAAANEDLPLAHHPALIFFDFCAAFPSVAHALIFLVFNAIGLPEGLINYFRALYADNLCFGCFEGEFILLYSILSGIIQGCPASGTIFVLVVDPFLRLLKACLQGSVSRAFADDIGTLIAQLLQLPTLHKAFKNFEDISGLALKHKKCVIVPLGRLIDDDRIKEVKNYISTYTPEWAAFDVRDCAEYLGMIVGPGGGNDASWEKPLNKFRNRSLDIAKSDIAPSIGIDLYNGRAVPTMSYVPQLCEITPKVEKEELLALQRVFHLPHHAFPKESYYYLLESGFRKIIPLKVTAKAALIRTAYRACTVWREELELLNKVRSDHAPLLHLVQFPSARFHPDNKWWKSASFVDNLHAATRYVANNNITIPKDERKGSFSLQTSVTRQIANIVLSSSLAKLVAPRLKRFFPHGKFNEAAMEQLLDDTITITKCLPPSVGLSIIKTWTNAWTTDRRMSNPVSPCRFGCRECPHNDDSLDHYLKCSKLHCPVAAFMKNIIGMDVGTTPCENLTFPLPHVKDDRAMRLCKIFKAHVVLDIYQITAANQRNGKAPNPPPLKAFIKEAFRKLSDLVPWVHKINSAQLKSSTKLNKSTKQNNQMFGCSEIPPSSSSTPQGTNVRQPTPLRAKKRRNENDDAITSRSTKAPRVESTSKPFSGKAMTVQAAPDVL
jgi:hypothetical protein